ncbi:hypothetical protein D3C72_2165010 [compost metagenome]
MASAISFMPDRDMVTPPGQAIGQCRALIEVVFGLLPFLAEARVAAVSLLQAPVTDCSRLTVLLRASVAPSSLSPNIR